MGFSRHAGANEGHALFPRVRVTCSKSSLFTYRRLQILRQNIIAFKHLCTVHGGGTVTERHCIMRVCSTSALVEARSRADRPLRSRSWSPNERVVLLWEARMTHE
jgi:hypothetical protein